MRIYLSFFVGLALTGCAGSMKTPQEQFEEVKVRQSYLRKDTTSDANQPELEVEGAEVVEPADFQRLRILSQGYEMPNKEKLQNKFSNSDSVSVAVDQMPVGEFLHYALGEQLSLNYVLAGDLPLNGSPVTLNIKDKMSSRDFFTLMQDVLQQRGMAITESNDVYYVVKAATTTKGNVAIGVGNLKRDVPNVATQVLQIIPTRFGISSTLERTLVDMIDASVVPDFEQNVLFIQGRRPEIIRAIELVQLLDKPLNRGKHVGIIQLAFINSENFIQQTRQLLQNEGATVGVGIGAGENVVFVPLAQIGAVAIFASDPTIINRVRFWGEQLDKPATNSESQYFMYTPRFARATDLGDSLAPLLGQLSQARRSNSSQSSMQQNSQGGSQTNTQTATRANRTAGNGIVNNLSLVVDERSNSLIFYGAGSEYQAILPLVKKLDVLPKQVLLEVAVVEVRLEGQFRRGVEWALRNNFGNGTTADSAGSTLQTLGALGVGTPGLSYVYNDLDFSVTASLFRNNTLANIVSNPTVVVRDGVTASMSVGSDIPIIGSTTVGDLNDPRNTTQFTYRKAGLQLDVKPTVNAQNIVLMEVSQYLSNTDPNLSTENPAFFERSLTTEIVAQSGQTILLGGIISEDNSDGDQSVPGLADIPILGNLFRGENRTSNKTELVVLVTARVLDNTEEWESIMRQFEGGLEGIKLNN